MKASTLIGTLAVAALTLTFSACSTSSDSTAKAPEAVATAGAQGASGASGASGPVAIKRYDMHGKIISLDAPNKAARIEAGPIGDWMGAMTMNYTIKDDAGYAKLAAGMDFDATVFVQGDDFWVGDIKPAAATK